MEPAGKAGLLFTETYQKRRKPISIGINRKTIAAGYHQG
jgi:hypothetical protein